MPPEPASLDPDLNALESGLAALPPSRPRLDRDRLMYEAGRASVGQTTNRHAWLAAACVTALAVVEGVLLVNRPGPRVVELLVVDEPARATVPAAVKSRPEPIPAPVRSRPSSPLVDAFLGGETPYQRLTGQVLRFGLDGLPPSPPAAWAAVEDSPKTPREQLRDELRRALEPGDRS
ncbi:hypothetical protein EP7_002772 [Isosphaeraceae bacterium EP7]